jgi:nucleotide-binding universal stress UspA family protein
MKKILITLDYDPSAQKVAEAGYELGKAMNAEIKLLHVLEDAVYYSSLEYSPIMGFGGFGMPDITQVPDEAALTAAASSFLKNTRTHLNDESIGIITEDGNPAESIVKVAKEMGSSSSAHDGFS